LVFLLVIASSSQQTDVTLRAKRRAFILGCRAASTTTSRIAGRALYSRDVRDSYLPSVDFKVKAGVEIEKVGY
jgi:hypothetical protein